MQHHLSMFINDRMRFLASCADFDLMRMPDGHSENSDFVIPALRQAQDKLAFGQAGIQSFNALDTDLRRCDELLGFTL